VIDVKSGMLELSGDVHIMTDAEEMERLYLQATSMSDSEEKEALLKKAFELYQGRVFELGDLDLGSWLIPFSTHYNQVFIDTAIELIKSLGHRKDFHCVLDYASRALRLEPGIQDAYYWLIVASENMGNSMTAGSYDKMAQEQLSEEEYDRLQQVLALRAHPEGETT